MSAAPRPVLLLHPLGADARFWDDVPLAGDRQWIAVDLPGHGAGPTPVVADGVAGLATYVEELLDQQGVDDYDVVGVSLGGLVAQHLAVLRPERVGRVALVDTVATYPAPVRAMWAARATTARDEGMSPLVEPTLDVWFGDETRRTRTDLVEQTTATLLRTDPEGYARTCEILAACDLTDLASRLPQGTLVVCGEDDGPHFRDAARDFAETVGTTVRWLPGKHAAVLESPELFANHLEQFLGADLGPGVTERTQS